MSMFNLCVPQLSINDAPFPKSILSDLNTQNPIFFVNEEMNGERNAVYHVNIISLLDRVFVLNSLKFLSIEQERYMTKFFNQAHEVNNVLDNNRINETNDNPYENMDRIMKQLDNFLGSYFGVNHGRFTR